MNIPKTLKRTTIIIESIWLLVLPHFLSLENCAFGKFGAS